ncbi:Uncharacterised protein [Mycolicibacterium phlei]|uniref:hypothetical protein n=1 Tax=Mycobacteroides chelonae TaxID=1774 RepID=UPI000618CA10|nr:hypothetical protein [Mycobacteroides chelonae]VEG17718.1 Uncharacterised protein [Mycolicibacterium phlei]AKC39421.1 hypothetical protein GR01_13820 [Mycobacteroides chelonae]ANA98886.1 hypothetical protein BB28_14655 [Mycobacteroides chelonae CCUG 47445]OLT72625.1 hypothetical protein BKG56_21755 [Mycobacteroides chelonae]ORV11953.1 hypothetical protein AWB96_21680 [Mycobacteroides chelonae]
MSDINDTENTSEVSEENTGEDPSSKSRIVKWSEQWWATKAKPGVRRCKAHRKNGNRCQRAAINGANVCPTHGGRAPQVQAAARRRLAEATDHMARELLKMAVDPNVNDAVKLKAMTEALDRGGVTTKSTATVEITAKPYEEVFDSVEVSGGTRADYRRSRGLADDSDTPPALAYGADDMAAISGSDSFLPIDVEFSNDESTNVRSQAQPMSHDDAQRQPYATLAGQTGPFRADREGVVTTPNRYDEPTTGCQSLEDALEAQAQMYRNAAATRGLPPGRTARG